MPEKILFCNFATEKVSTLSMKIGIIVAMDKEFTQLKTLLSESQTERKNFKDFVIGKIGDNEVVMQQ